MNTAEIKAPEIKRTDVEKALDGDKLDILNSGIIRIPVCGAEEATANLNKGREYYGDSLNYPCNA
jgi:hypothetical protein